MRIIQAEFIQSAVKNSQMPSDGRKEFMFCGRSNVGKSSFINALTNRKNLARTSQTPGKTQTLNIFLINNDFYFVDVPGYGYASVSKSMKAEFGRMIEEYVINRSELKKVFLLVDFRHAPSKDDCLMYEFLKYYDCNIVIVATKGDKVKKSQFAKQTKLIKETLKLGSTDKLIVTSSETKQGLEQVLEELESSLLEDNNNLEEVVK